MLCYALTNRIPAIGDQNGGIPWPTLLLSPFIHGNSFFFLMWFSALIWRWQCKCEGCAETYFCDTCGFTETGHLFSVSYCWKVAFQVEEQLKENDPLLCEDCFPNELYIYEERIFLLDRFSSNKYLYIDTCYFENPWKSDDDLENQMMTSQSWLQCLVLAQESCSCVLSTLWAETCFT